MIVILGVRTHGNLFSQVRDSKETISEEDEIGYETNLRKHEDAHLKGNLVSVNPRV